MLSCSDNLSTRFRAMICYRRPENPTLSQYVLCVFPKLAASRLPGN